MYKKKVCRATAPLLSLLPEALFLLYPYPAQAPPPTAPPVNGAFVGASQHSEGILAGEGSSPERATALH